ncbi:DinB family protein [Amycolatopsis sp. YIM 10]|uniref:DinB family protein n=1 Tax=Amycolatopsis sp. YIM 10 TaxID=2653857 RepID=UPI0012900E9C|nr:DinB family protein [Amycolatopsis sp. YIM 10]QFU92933.1 DinB superfamily protein [Amycolatopsis sp. YIM 10]
MDQVRTDRLGLLVDQFDRAREQYEPRLADLTDDEYLWEPVPGAWSLRRRGEAVSPKPLGTGEWVLDDAPEDPDPAPVTTIAWRLCHLQWSFDGRWEWTFGARTRPTRDVEFSPHATEAVDRFWATATQWRDDVNALEPGDLDITGFGTFSNGWDPDVPFVAVLWWVNLEFIHHMAEIALLRDLWTHRVSPTPR